MMTLYSRSFLSSVFSILVAFMLIGTLSCRSRDSGVSEDSEFSQQIKLPVENVTPHVGVEPGIDVDFELSEKTYKNPLPREVLIQFALDKSIMTECEIAWVYGFVGDPSQREFMFPGPIDLQRFPSTYKFPELFPGLKYTARVFLKVKDGVDEKTLMDRIRKGAVQASVLSETE